MMTVKTAINTGSRQLVSRNRLTQRRLIITLVVLSVVLVLLGLFAIALGSEHVSITSILKIIASGITGGATDVSPEQKIIIVDIRLPRVLMAIVVGAALSVAGAAYQALLRNPLAEPYVLGVSTGAALGAIAAIVFAESLPI